MDTRHNWYHLTLHPSASKCSNSCPGKPISRDYKLWKDHPPRSHPIRFTVAPQYIKRSISLSISVIFAMVSRTLCCASTAYPLRHHRSTNTLRWRNLSELEGQVPFPIKYYLTPRQGQVRRNVGIPSPKKKLIVVAGREALIIYKCPRWEPWKPTKAPKIFATFY